MDEEMCVVGPSSWSIITSAGTNSQLAGVLAGFMIAVIAVLIIGSDRLNTHTVALFSSGALALGLDSYLFSGITGTRPPTNDSDAAKEICKVVWSQGMAASGLLAVGGSVFVCGLGWMLVNHVARGSALLTRHRRIYLVRLAGALTAGILVTTTTLLVSTTNFYLRYLEANACLSWFVTVFGVVIALWSCIEVTWRSCAMIKQFRHVTASTEVKTSLGMLPSGTFAVTGLAITGTSYAGLLNLWSSDINVAIAALAVIAGLLVPGAVSVIISRSVPSPQLGQRSP